MSLAALLAEASSLPEIRIRKEMPDVALTREAFAHRWRKRFCDPALESLSTEIDRIIKAAWNAYEAGRKAPHTREAGEGYADPGYQLSVDWIEASRRIKEAEQRQKNPASAPRILVINGAARSEHTCPGETSKTWRLAMIAYEIFAQEPQLEIEMLDLSRLVSEYGRIIYPCKTCVSTAMPLCHWPCSCYPNHSLGQVQDWMNEIYPMWAAAHGIMIVSPVNWYQAPSVLKLMIDRLVCADGGNPDPTSTHGKNAARAKEIEIAGWAYPRHLAGRVFSVVVHGDAAGVEALQDSLTSWLSDMGLIAAGHMSQLGRYVGYMQPYASSHDALDKDAALHEETRNAARALVRAVKLMRSGGLLQPETGLREPRPK
jgi:multimeric flavodoxin WrbA